MCGAQKVDPEDAAMALKRAEALHRSVGLLKIVSVAANPAN